MRLVALGIFIVAALSDAVDGYIARRSGQNSRAGLVLDPLGDKMLLMSAFICLTFIREFAIRFPFWVTFIILTRDILIILGAVVVYIVKQEINVMPTRWGKLTTTFQMLAVSFVLLQVSMNVSQFLWWLAVFFTVVSGADYINRGFKALYALDNSRNSH